MYDSQKRKLAPTSGFGNHKLTATSVYNGMRMSVRRLVLALVLLKYPDGKRIRFFKTGHL